MRSPTVSVFTEGEVKANYNIKQRVNFALRLLWDSTNPPSQEREK